MNKPSRKTHPHHLHYILHWNDVTMTENYQVLSIWNIHVENTHNSQTNIALKTHSTRNTCLQDCVVIYVIRCWKSHMSCYSDAMLILSISMIWYGISILWYAISMLCYERFKCYDMICMLSYCIVCYVLLRQLK